MSRMAQQFADAIDGLQPTSANDVVEVGDFLLDTATYDGRFSNEVDQAFQHPRR